MYKRAPLSSSFMLVGILGFIITIAFWIIGGRMSDTWGFTLTLFFVIMFVASLISLRATVVRLESEKKPVVFKPVKKKVTKRKPVKKVAKKRVVKKKPKKKVGRKKVAKRKPVKKTSRKRVAKKKKPAKKKKR